MKELFQRTRKGFTPAARSGAPAPENLWTKCPGCGQLIYRRQLAEALRVCAHCGHHMRLPARSWLGLLDAGSFCEVDAGLRSADPLGFTTGRETYAGRLEEAQARTGELDAVISGAGAVQGRGLCVAVCNFAFMGASMGSVYGEKLARAAERAADARLPLLTISCSGGARMQEGVLALLQMAKISAALTRIAAAGRPHIALLVDPCYGGVTASYASTADIIIAEPGARIGFAGRRVIEQTIRQKLPPEFQTAEFLLEHGMVDMVVPRAELRATIARLLRLYGGR